MYVREKLLASGGCPRWVDRYLKLVLVSGLSGYRERHHVLPQCLFPDHAKDGWNLVTLPARHHYIAHLVLSKAFPEHHGLALAARLMLRGVGVGTGVERYSSRLYSSLRERESRLSSQRWTGISRCAGPDNPSWGLFGPGNPRYGQKRTPTQSARITVGLHAHRERMNTDPDYRDSVHANMRAAASHPESRAKKSAAKQGVKNPNHGKDITNSFTPEQRAKQVAAIKAGQLKRMPWESARWTQDKDVFWSKADQLSELLKTDKTKSEIFMALFGRKDISVWNACGTLIDKLNAGWDPLKCGKWLTRYKEHPC